MGTLVQDLGLVADDIRASVHDIVGTRPYRVMIVRTRWTGTRRGRGEEVVQSEREILPTPRVSGVSSLDWALHPVGRSEEGELELSEISLTYSEDDLFLTGAGPADQFYYEIRQDSGRRRRAVPTASPELRPGSASWTIRVQIQNNDRTASGRPG